MSDAATGWTDDRVELLAKLWGEGLSASQIAAALGGGVTRNAVIGKVHRLGLSGRVKAGAAAGQRATKPRLAPAPVPAPPGGAEVSRLLPREPEQRPAPTAVDNRWAAEEVATPTELVTILDLRDSMCKWPIGDPAKPDFGFCGGRSVGGLPYCAHHCRMAYQPAAERKRLRA